MRHRGLWWQNSLNWLRSSNTIAASGRKLYYLSFLVLVVSPGTCGYDFLLASLYTSQSISESDTGFVGVELSTMCHAIPQCYSQTLVFSLQCVSLFLFVPSSVNLLWMHWPASLTYSPLSTVPWTWDLTIQSYVSWAPCIYTRTVAVLVQHTIRLSLCL
jgi:hypothetical protein